MTDDKKEVRGVRPVRLSGDEQRFRNALLHIGADSSVADKLLEIYRNPPLQDTRAIPWYQRNALALAEASDILGLRPTFFKDMLDIYASPTQFIGSRSSFSSTVRENDPEKRERALKEIRKAFQNSVNFWNESSREPRFKDHFILSRVIFEGQQIIVSLEFLPRKQKATS